MEDKKNLVDKETIPACISLKVPFKIEIILARLI